MMIVPDSTVTFVVQPLLVSALVLLYCWRAEIGLMALSAVGGVVIGQRWDRARSGQ
jgi:hypothetical protein